MKHDLTNMFSNLLFDPCFDPFNQQYRETFGSDLLVRLGAVESLLQDERVNPKAAADKAIRAGDKAILAKLCADRRLVRR